MIYDINKSVLLEEAFSLLEEAGKGSIKKDRYKKKDQKFEDIKNSAQFKETKAEYPLHNVVARTKSAPINPKPSARGGESSAKAGLGKEKEDKTKLLAVLKSEKNKSNSREEDEKKSKAFEQAKQDVKNAKTESEKTKAIVPAVIKATETPSSKRSNSMKKVLAAIGGTAAVGAAAAALDND